MTDDLDTQEDWGTPADRARDIAQAKAMREQASKGGVALPTGSKSDGIEINGMKHTDFQIGMEFFTATGRWRVTDIGTRTIIAIKLDQTDPRNYSGPPYSIVERVLDEHDFGGCEPA